MLHYSYVLPLELNDLKGNKQVRDKIDQAWFHRKSGNCDVNVEDDFYVTLDGCLVHFVVDSKLTGRRPDGSKHIVVSGIVIKLSSERAAQLALTLKTVERELNAQIAPLQPQPDFGRKTFGGLP